MYNRKARLPVQLDHLEEEEIDSSHEFDEEEHLKRVENMKVFINRLEQIGLCVLHFRYMHHFSVYTLNKGTTFVC